MKKNFLLFAAIVLVMGSCKKDDPESPATVADNGHYAYVLNEGNWGSNDASLSLLNLDNGSITNHWFATANGRGLGDVAQDLIHYGGKLYTSVYMSNTIEVIDPATGKSIKQINMGQRGPRYLAYHNGKVYVSCYDKTLIRIDTASLAIDASCTLSGMQPEQLCIAGDKLYVCNAWQYDNEGSAIYDSTLSVVDLNAFAEIDKIVVGCNPNRVKALDSRHLLVACAGDYGSHPATTMVVNLDDQSVADYQLNVTNFDIHNGSVYAYATAYAADWSTTALFYRDGTPILQSFSDQLADAYGINVNPINGNIFVCNSAYGVNSDIFCFAADGTKRFTCEAQTYASKVVF